MDHEVQIRILDAAYRGSGVGKLSDGCVVFVAHTLPGELVAAKIVRRRKNFAEARLIQVLEAAPGRIAPACPLAGSCPGCCYQHAAYDTEVQLKQQQFAALLRRIAGITLPALSPPDAAPEPLRYRNKIVLHADGAARPSLGYFKEDNRTILDVPACPLAAEPIGSLLTGLRGDPAFLRSLRPHTSVTMRWTEHDGAMHWLNRAPDEASRRAPGNWLTENTGIGALRAPRGSFFQVNPGAADALLARVREHVEAIRPAAVIDLYCGVGIFALSAALAGCTRVVGVDSDEAAIHAAGANATQLGVSGAVQFLARPADAGLAATETPGGEETLLIVDPPRDGLLPGVLDEIGRRRFADVIYISCAADTLARDIKRLAAHGYGVAASRLVDMFPRTAYFESVTHLRR